MNGERWQRGLFVSVPRPLQMEGSRQGERSAAEWMVLSLTWRGLQSTWVRGGRIGRRSCANDARLWRRLVLFFLFFSFTSVQELTQCRSKSD